MSNTVPEGWERKLLKDTVSTVIAGQSPNRKDHAAKAGKYGILKTTAIDWGKYSPDKNQEVLDDFKVNPKHEVKTGDILITKAGPVHRVGVVTYVPATPEKMLVSGKMTLLRTGSLHDPLFLSYALATEYSQKPLKESTTGMALSQSNFTHETLLKVPLWVPQALPEQQKIATILSSVDHVIEKTRAQINKLKDLKTGMMQELLTKGIGSDGVPHTEFKDSPVGRVPIKWNAALLDKVATRGSGHTPSKSNPEYWNGGVDWVSLSDTNKLDRLYIATTVKQISELGIQNSSAVIHPPGTVVLSRDAGIGKSGIITREMAVSQHFIAWRCSDQLHNHFLYYVLQFWKPKFEAIAMGSTIKTIGLPFFKKLHVPVPPISEQIAIAGTLQSIDLRVFTIERKLNATVAVKKALMQDLLTGKVRVNAREKETAVA